MTVRRSNTAVVLMGDDRNPIRLLNGTVRRLVGTYVRLPTDMAVDAVAEAGLDFVRFDQFKLEWTGQTLARLVRHARSRGLLTWARSRHEPVHIEQVVASGVQVVTFPDVGSLATARRLIAATAAASQQQGAYPEIAVGCQIEDADGLANYRDIVAAPDIDVIHTGRNDLSRALGVAGDQFHPRVLEAERRIVEAALDVGKQVSLLFPLDDDGLERARDWLAAGVQIVALDTDYLVLRAAYARGLERIGGAAP